MRGLRNARPVRNSLGLAAITLLTSACLDFGAADESAEERTLETELSGSVGDGPVAGAAMRVVSSGGDLLAEFESDATGNYGITVLANDSDFPLFIDASNGIDLVANAKPDFVLRGMVLANDNSSVANINPFSTLAFEIARDSDGGLTKANIENAQRIAVSSMNSGLTTLVDSGPIDTRIDSRNIAEIVKASETLAEIMRRTRDWLLSTGTTINADVVVRTLGSDLIDEMVDGSGGPRADARTAALATVVSAQVLLESMSNELHVNGTDATNAMRLAIDQVSPGVAEPSLDDLRATAGMIEAARLGVRAAAAVSSNPEIVKIENAISGIQAGMDPILVKSLLPVDYRQALDDALTLIAFGDNSVFDIVNDVVRTENGSNDPDQPDDPVDPVDPIDPVPPANNAPTISGVPAGDIQAGSAFSFTPSAADADGDPLTFSIAGRPGWAGFDAATGRLSGTPSDGDVGAYANIVISVTDGMDTVSLAPFSLTVNALSLGSVTLSWTPPTQNEDGTPLLDLAGYRIYWGTVSGVYPNSVSIDNPGLSTYVVENLAPGSYEFVATSYNSAGVESRYSGAATKVVP